MVPAQTASAQTLDDSVRAVQPNDVRKAERHQARPSGNDAVAAAVAQERAQKPADRVQVQNPPRSTAMNRTARAHLESHSQAIGLPALAMICQDCEPEPPRCRRGCQNSSIIDGATIDVAAPSTSRQRQRMP
jgi:hypothetical protein